MIGEVEKDPWDLAFKMRKGNKPVGDAASYRPRCLLDTMGKLLEEMVQQRLQGHMVGENGLSENQFGFRKGRSTVDAIQAVVDIATKARRGTGKRKGFCARWNNCIETMVRKRVPDCLLRMIDDYLSNRWVIYEGDKWSLKEEMTCGAPQGSRMGPLVWNVMYDDFLRMDLCLLERASSASRMSHLTCALLTTSEFWS